MKLKTITSALVLVAALTSTGFAVTEISEQFTATSLSKTRWYGYDFGNGSLKQTNRVLNFISNSPGQHDYSSIELIQSQPGYNESWQLILELANKTDNGFDSGCGISITNNEDRNDYIYINFHGKKGVSGGVIVDGEPSHARQFAFPLPIEKGAIRIRFDKDKKLMILEASETLKSEGYNFKKLGAFSPANSAPVGSTSVIKADWKMTAMSRFAIQLTGFTNNKNVAKGAITMDNFKLTGRP